MINAIGPQEFTQEDMKSAIEHSTVTIARSVSERIVPAYRSDLEAILNLVPSNANIENQLQMAFGHRYDKDYRKGVARFLNDIGFRLMSMGKALYRINWKNRIDYAKKSLSTEKHFTFDYIAPELIRRTDRGIVFEARESFDRMEEIPLAPEERLIFMLPPSIPFATLEEIYKDIANLELLTIPNEIISSIGKEQAMFDLEAHKRDRALILAQSTKSLGWFSNEFLKGESLPYYHWRRRLTFESIVIDIRTEILKTFNLGLSRIGQLSDYYGHLRLDSLPTSKNVETALIELEEGRLTFRQIFSPFNPPKFEETYTI